MASLNWLRAAAWLLMGAALPAAAQELDWAPLPYHYVAQGENLRDVLINFGANYDSRSLSVTRSTIRSAAVSTCPRRKTSCNK